MNDRLEYTRRLARLPYTEVLVGSMNILSINPAGTAEGNGREVFSLEITKYNIIQHPLTGTKRTADHNNYIVIKQ